MSTNIKLIARLRLGASISRERKLNQGYDVVADEAADAIEALEAEIQRQYACIRSHAEITHKAEDERDALQAQLAAAQGQEPIGFVESAVRGAGGFHAYFSSGVFIPAGTQLYTAPIPQQPAQQAHPEQGDDIYKFAGWLSSRKEVLEIGSSKEAGPMAEAVCEYLLSYPERFKGTPQTLNEFDARSAQQAQPVNAMLLEALEAAEKLEHTALVALSEATDELKVGNTYTTATDTYKVHNDLIHRLDKILNLQYRDRKREARLAAQQAQPERTALTKATGGQHE